MAPEHAAMGSADAACEYLRVKEMVAQDLLNPHNPASLVQDSDQSCKPRSRRLSIWISKLVGKRGWTCCVERSLEQEAHRLLPLVLLDPSVVDWPGMLSNVELVKLRSRCKAVSHRSSPQLLFLDPPTFSFSSS
jgi:hypothetical protein